MNNVKTLEITINGRKAAVSRNPLPYNSIAIAAGYAPEMSPSVTFRHAGPEGANEGILAPDESVTVNEHTIINCHDTSNA